MKPATLETGNAIPLLRTLDIRLTRIDRTSAVMEVDVAQKHLNYFGGTHGGLIATLVDTVCFFPEPLLPSGRMVTTANLAVNYVRPAACGDHLQARSEIVHLGRRTVSLTACVTNGDGKLVAHGSATLLILGEPQKDSDAGAPPVV